MSKKGNPNPKKQNRIHDYSAYNKLNNIARNKYNPHVSCCPYCGHELTYTVRKTKKEVM